MNRFLFPRWVNKFLLVLGFLALGGGAYAGVVFLGATDPKTLNPGYQPVQPVPFSHKIHAGQLKMDCRYCHTSVEKAAHASVPPTSTCINCHSPLEKATGTPALAAVHPDSPKLKALHQSWESGNSVPWARIHRLPDFVYFNHAAHISSGVSCVTCHDRIDKMEVVYQAKELSMTWCVDCHRNPEPHLRPVEFVTKLDWKPEDGTDPAVLGAQLKKDKNINPLANCAVCHR
ncbi:MAG: hypothetical protein RLY14_931 [Planctomycetota bacterium]